MDPWIEEKGTFQAWLIGAFVLYPQYRVPESLTLRITVSYVFRLITETSFALIYWCGPHRFRIPTKGLASVNLRNTWVRTLWTDILISPLRTLRGGFSRRDLPVYHPLSNMLWCMALSALSTDRTLVSLRPQFHQRLPICAPSDLYEFPRPSFTVGRFLIGNFRAVA